MGRLNMNIKQVLNFIVILAVAFTPLAPLSYSFAQEPKDSSSENFRDLFEVDGSKQETTFTTISSVDELKEALKKANLNASEMPLVTVFEPEKSEVDLARLNADADLVSEIIGGYYQEKPKKLKFNSTERKGFLKHIRNAKDYLGARLTPIIDNISENHQFAYKFSLATVRAGGLFSAMTYSYVMLGVPVIDAATGTGIASSVTFLIQYYGTKYLEILGDPNAYTKFAKWLKAKGLRFTGHSESEILESLKKTDNNKFLKWLSQRETLVSYSLYLLTEYPIVLAVTAAIFGLPSGTEATLAYLASAGLVSLSALASQGVVESALAISRREQLIKVMKDLFSTLEDDLAKAGSNFERDQIIHEYEEKLESLRRLDLFSEGSLEESDIKLSGQKKNLIEFLMRSKLFVVAILSNTASFAAGGDIIKLFEILLSGEFTTLPVVKQVAFSTILSMFIGGLSYKAYLNNKYDLKGNKADPSPRFSIKRIKEKVRSTCENLLKAG